MREFRWMMQVKFRSLFCLFCFLGTTFLRLTELSSAEINFNRDVRPILSDACFQCHGPDEENREADLRLDTFAGAIAKIDDHFAIVPGKPLQSTVYGRINSTDSDELMPPPDSKKKLTPAQIQVIQQWIKQGAQYEKHWAFQPIRNPELPSVSQKQWGHNGVDAFVLKQLEKRGISPSSEADRYTLIRRVTLDLTGLPPTPQEVKSFLADRSENAYEEIVDHLLNSPHYGEKWGRHWLDQARYADTDGYTVDAMRSMWPYRDWVIAALNRDQPFDQFTIEQIAGDLLDNPTQEQLIATGFHRNTLINGEGGTDNEQFRNEAVVDRVNTTGVVWLGLSVGCAQCHNHKFDPITQREYYQMFAFFNSSQDVNSRNPKLSLPTPEHQEKLNQLAQRLKQAKAKLTAYDQRKKKAASADQNNASKPVNWQELSNLQLESTAGATFEILEDNSVLASGNNGNKEQYTIRFSSKADQITAIKLEALTHLSLPKTGPGRAGNGNFVLNEIEFSQSGKPPEEWLHATAGHSQKDYPVLAAIDADIKTGWAINGSTGSMNVNRTAQFVLEKPFAVTANSELTIKLKFGNEPAKYNIGRFQLSISDSPISKFDIPDAQRIKLAASVKKTEAEKSKLTKTIPTTLVMRELPEPRTTNILIRGDFLRKGAGVHSGYPAVLSTSLQTKKNLTRLDFANWLVDKKNPLPARVIVNRIWMRYFGQGFVETENDFGYQGALPTHPELLDWLASSFIRNGWSQKFLHRLIVTSATYRQASHVRAELNQVDPSNKLLSRQTRLRVDAENVRDLALSVSGLLTTKIGGPSVFPPQPDGVYSFTQNRYQWKTSTGEDRYRRGMYTFFIRSAPYPMLTTFDVPRFNSACTKRNRSNTPLQSLAVANDETMIEFARALGRRSLAQNLKTDNQKLQYAFQLCLTRPANSQELDQLAHYLNDQRKMFEHQTENAQLVAGAKVNKKVTASEAASWTAVARVLMNLDEFITRE